MERRFMTFLEECRAARVTGRTDADDSQVHVLRDWLTSRPDALFEQLREHMPTLVLGRMALVTRFDDVRDVLGRNDVFSVKPYGDAMRRINRGPDFLLGMDDGPEYQQQLSVLRRVFRRDDAARVRQTLALLTVQALKPALAAGRLDLTDGFGRLVPSLFVADYIGVPGPDCATLMKWARSIFTEGFVNVLGIPLLSRRAMRDSAAFRSYLDDLLSRIRADRRRGGAASDDVVNRLLTLEESGEVGLSDARIRDNLLWCIAGMIDNVNTAVARVMDYLLGHPEVMQGAARAARAGDGALLEPYVLESLRFHTPTPVVTRLNVAPFTLSKGTRHETTIPAGTLTFVGVGAAMMDGAVVAAPAEFRLDRPAEHYLHFGAGLHQCLGSHIAMAQVTTMVAGLLKVSGLRRARGVTGRLRVTGVFPRTFVVEMPRVT
jgi:cytochrome P450